MNKVILIGNLTKNPEPRQTSTGKTMSLFTVAINNPYSKKTDFLNCIAWDRSANFLNAYLKKGEKILVEGRIENNNYEDPQTGQTIYSTRIVAENVESLSFKRDSNQNNSNINQFENVAPNSVIDTYSAINTDSTFTPSNRSIVHESMDDDDDSWASEE